MQSTIQKFYLPIQEKNYTQKDHGLAVFKLEGTRKDAGKCDL